jgi:hypothetical protein
MEFVFSKINPLNPPCQGTSVMVPPLKTPCFPPCQGESFVSPDKGRQDGLYFSTNSIAFHVIMNRAILCNLHFYWNYARIDSVDIDLKNRLLQKGELST